jgi:enediyne biosynthesis protein E5
MPPVKPHLKALRRFAIAITVLNVLGHTVLGFEQSWAQPLVALATAYGMELCIERIDAWSTRRRTRFTGCGFRGLVDFLLSAHITGLACGMLLYTNERLWPTMFAVALAIGSKTVLRVPVGTGTRHVFNPSNFGITLTLLLFPWVGIAPPYHFTENLTGAGDWILPGIIVLSGSFLNARLTHRMTLIAGWLGGFFLQATLRHFLFGSSLLAAWAPMTGMAFLLYTFYMVTDPATTPSDPRGQVLFGASVAAVYGTLMALHIVFGLFFALTIVCTVRGLSLYVRALLARREQPAEHGELLAARTAVEHVVVLVGPRRNGHAHTEPEGAGVSAGREQ